MLKAGYAPPDSGLDLIFIILALGILSACDLSGIRAETTSSPAWSGHNPPTVPEATAAPPQRTYWDCAAKPVECPDDVEDWLARLHVPPSFVVSHVGRLPGDVAPTSITFGPDGQLYIATIPRPFEENFAGAIYVLSQAGELAPVADGFLLPTGLAFEPGSARLRKLTAGCRT